jgi:ADP-ribosylation factor-like protein 6
VPAGVAVQLRMCVVKDELDSLLAHKDLGPVPILFLANKMDLPNALSTLECVAALGLDSITDKPYNVFATDAMNDRGLKEAEAWLLDQMSR